MFASPLVVRFWTRLQHDWLRVAIRKYFQIALGFTIRFTFIADIDVRRGGWGRPRLLSDPNPLVGLVNEMASYRRLARHHLHHPHEADGAAPELQRLDCRHYVYITCCMAGRLREASMNRLRCLITAFLLLAVACGVAVGVEAENDGKVVRLVWFPRFSPDGKWLLSAHGSWDQKEAGEVRVWNAETGQPKFVIPSQHGVRTVGWSPKGSFFASGSYGGWVRFYDPQTGKPTGDMKFPASVEVLQISPDETRLITAHGSGWVIVSELPSKKELYAWKGAHQGGIWGMRLSPNGKTLATAGKDGYVRLFDMDRFEKIQELKHPTETNGLAFTGDGKTLLTGCGDSIIRVFDVASGRQLQTITGHAGGSITDMQFSPDGQLLATSGIDRTVRLWDVSDLAKPSLKETLQGHTNLVFGAAISYKGKWLASAGWDDQVLVWDLTSQPLAQKWSWHR